MRDDAQPAPAQGASDADGAGAAGQAAAAPQAVQGGGRGREPVAQAAAVEPLVIRFLRNHWGWLAALAAIAVMVGLLVLAAKAHHARVAIEEARPFDGGVYLECVRSYGGVKSQWAVAEVNAHCKRFARDVFE